MKLLYHHKSLKLFALSLIIISGGALSACQNSYKQQKSTHPRTAKISHSKTISKNVSIYKPSQKKPYPKQLSPKYDQIIVSIPKQRAYIQHNHHTIYTMYISTGSHDRTPRGIYHIQSERGDYFYSKNEHEGARYYTSWKGHGVYLFHATPNNQKKQIYKTIAHDLGKKPSSHGCIHLTFPDAKYIEHHAPVGLKIVIE